MTCPIWFSWFTWALKVYMWYSVIPSKTVCWNYSPHNPWFDIGTRSGLLPSEGSCKPETEVSVRINQKIMEASISLVTVADTKQDPIRFTLLALPPAAGRWIPSSRATPACVAIPPLLLFLKNISGLRFLNLRRCCTHGLRQGEGFFVSSINPAMFCRKICLMPGGFIFFPRTIWYLIGGLSTYFEKEVVHILFIHLPGI